MLMKRAVGFGQKKKNTMHSRAVEKMKWFVEKYEKEDTAVLDIKSQEVIDQENMYKEDSAAFDFTEKQVESVTG